MYYGTNLHLKNDDTADDLSLGLLKGNNSLYGFVYLLQIEGFLGLRFQQYLDGTIMFMLLQQHLSLKDSYVVLL
ncbi:hypothetical protein CJF31_00006568 [Rutstroemia sp. NJR-2017a BVV2]|nr:hypothetical protein CJF31_00006568 [Rutstroemia sp. NJR-2017a BVV2]